MKTKQKTLLRPTCYIGRIEAFPGRLLLGGVKRVQSAPFDTREEAQAWRDAMMDQSNAASGGVFPVN